MTTLRFARRFSRRLPRVSLAHAWSGALAAGLLVLAACGGGSADAPPPSEPAAPGIAPPVITQQPAALTVTAGQPASFSVAASGVAPLSYQWQRGGAAIAGATAATYTVAAAVLGDSGATFRAIVGNAGGSVTSQAAPLTVTQSAPVLTVTQQPANASVVAGSAASFTVAATCSNGALGVQWQRSQSGGAFAMIAGATATTYTLTTVIGDSGATFRAGLDCGGQSAATSLAATLTVTSPSGASLGDLAVNGLRGQADVVDMTAITAMPDGSYLLFAGSRLKRLAADLSSITTLGGGNGAVDGPLADARFARPSGIAADAAGVVYVADTTNHTIRRIDANGMVSTVAGLAGSSGSADGTGMVARFFNPRDIYVGPDGDLYVADGDNHRIRRVSTAGAVTTYAGSSQGFANGPAATAQFSQPSGLVVASNGDVIVADTNNHRIRRILRVAGGAGAVETLAGDGGQAQFPYLDGIGTAANIGSPRNMTLSGNVVTLMSEPGLIRRLDLSTRAVTRLTGERGPAAVSYRDGGPAIASFATGDLATAPADGVVFLDERRKLRLSDATGTVRTIAYTPGGGDPDSTGVLAQLPIDLAAGNGNSNRIAIAGDRSGGLVIVARNAKLVRRIDSAGNVALVAGLYASSDAGSVSSLDGNGSSATFQSLGEGLDVEATGVIWAADDGCVRRIDTSNEVTTPAGNCDQGSIAVDGPGATARFVGITGLAVAPGGMVFVAESNNRTIRRIDAAFNVTTWAGVANQAGSADGPVASARFQAPGSLAVAPDGALHVVDNGTLRRIAADGSSVSTIAAAGTQVRQIAIDGSGTVFYLTATSDLFMLPAGAAAAALLVPGGSAGVVLGGPPTARLHLASKLAFTAPKTLVVQCEGRLVVVTLP